MTSPTDLMTGRRETTDGRTLLVIERAYRAPLEDVWAACTEPGRMERWVGTWSGDPDSGTITFRMTAEGEDAIQAVDQIAALIAAKFDEE